jgi:hypothetical protein
MSGRTRRVWRAFRSAVTGRFVRRQFADSHPDTTVSETQYVYTDDQRRNLDNDAPSDQA